MMAAVTIHVSQRAGSDQFSSGYPADVANPYGGLAGAAARYDHTAVDSGDTSTIVPAWPGALADGWTDSFAVGDLVRIDPTGVNELRQVVSKTSSSLTVHAPCSVVSDKWLHHGGDLFAVQQGLDAVAALQSTIPGPWVVNAATGTYVITTALSIGVAGTATAPNTLQLASGAILDAVGIAVNCLTTSLSGSLYWRILGGIYRNATGVGITLPDDVTIVDAVVEDCGSHGVYLGYRPNLYGVAARSNAGRGIVALGYGHAFHCVAGDNGDDQFNFGILSTLHKCRAYGLGSAAGIATQHGTYGIDVLGCTVDGGSGLGVGIIQRNNGPLNVLDTIVTRCATGISCGQNNGGRNVSRNNLLFGNTVNYSNYATDSGEVLADPLFAAPDAAVPDYRLRAGSPAIGRGLGGGDIGALQLAGIPVALGMNGGFNG